MAGACVLLRDVQTLDPWRIAARARRAGRLKRRGLARRQEVDMNRRTTLAWASGLLGMLAPALSWAQPATEVFVHRATTGNTQSNRTFIQNRLTNDRPGAVVFVTPTLTPLSGAGPLSPNVVSVVFDRYRRLWAIVDQSNTPIRIGAAFNVRVSAYESVASQGRRHRATPANTVANFTDIDDSALNNNPYAVVIVNHSAGLPDDPLGFHNHVVGVSYNNATRKWSIFNEDYAPMPVGTSFNYIAGVGAFVHRATPDNTGGVQTYFDHVRTTGRPGALILATHNRSLGGVIGPQNDSPLNMRYVGTRWGIFNARFGRNIVFGAAFNVLPLN
jgi:hypothetical protein